MKPSPFQVADKGFLGFTITFLSYFCLIRTHIDFFFHNANKQLKNTIKMVAFEVCHAFKGIFSMNHSSYVILVWEITVF